ncbi:hypothetical protein [Polynucleobacter sphagniphilus]|jgi:hypothetical protein|uniref:Uncharacterized protein n=1 Tax=Polynucleobacter sphagniphilus TaxID=1743169 RepID=A0AA43S6I8_9BURK|nr:hypothetical protein [Polynucleobacter sphagniphilus]MDH6504773.1 hypothetical protein [Polynucleobacter sphagniphilus]MDH6513482.1 hypothetical protein [Polynucleobacter sphagniphilus]
MSDFQYADVITKIYVTNGIVRLELANNKMNDQGQIELIESGTLVLHLNGFLNLKQQMEQLTQKLIEDKVLVSNNAPAKKTKSSK